MGVGRDDKAIATHNLTRIGVPHYHLHITILGQITLVHIHGAPRTSARIPKGYLAQTSNLHHHSGTLMPTNHIDKVVRMVGLAQQPLWRQLLKNRPPRHPADNSFRTHNILLSACINTTAVPQPHKPNARLPFLSKPPTKRASHAINSHHCPQKQKTPTSRSGPSLFEIV